MTEKLPPVKSDLRNYNIWLNNEDFYQPMKYEVVLAMHILKIEI